MCYCSYQAPTSRWRRRNYPNASLPLEFLFLISGHREGFKASKGIFPVSNTIPVQTYCLICGWSWVESGVGLGDPCRSLPNRAILHDLIKDTASIPIIRTHGRMKDNSKASELCSDPDPNSSGIWCRQILTPLCTSLPKAAMVGLSRTQNFFQHAPIPTLFCAVINRNQSWQWASECLACCGRWGQGSVCCRDDPWPASHDDPREFTPPAPFSWKVITKVWVSKPDWLIELKPNEPDQISDKARAQLNWSFSCSLVLLPDPSFAWFTESAKLPDTETGRHSICR